MAKKIDSKNVDHTAEVLDYLRQIHMANSESARRGHLQGLLRGLFGNDVGAKEIINRIVAGTEQAIKIPRKGGATVGHADMGYDQVIIEWKQNLRDKNRSAAAKEQLTKYLHGKWHEGNIGKYTLLATDGVIWRRYASSYETVSGQTADQPPQLKEVKGGFELRENNAAEFYFFLDRWFFRRGDKKLTLENIALDFGESSGTFLHAVTSMQNNAVAQNHSETQTALGEWRRMLSIAYAAPDDSFAMFVFQTYLSAFAKLLAYSFLTKHADFSDKKIVEVLRGQAFDEFNVDNFAEGDFFSWVAKDYCLNDSLSWCRDILIKLSEYDLTTADEDIFKGLYQEVIDNETRHSLGEYYTPDWLCERIVDELAIDENSRVLDPACGSGSFLRAAMTAIRRKNPKAKAEKLAANIVGIDIHPLAVQISKTTLLMALGPLDKSPSPVLLQVYLANALLLNKDASLYGEIFDVAINATKYQVHLAEFGVDMEKYDRAVQFCDHYASDEKEQTAENFAHRFAVRFSLDKKSAVIADFYKIYKAFRQARQDGKNSIWRFVLQNLYKPIFIHRQFDVVVGNPPWLTYSDVVNAEYQGMLRGLANILQVTPYERANMPHLEIAALFLSHASSYFLRADGKIAFVLPRSFLTAAQHENTRQGFSKGFQLSSIWDLEEVSPLFNVPATVFFGKQKAHMEVVKFPSRGLIGASFSGVLPNAQTSWALAKNLITEKKTRWHLARLVSTTNNGNGITAIADGKIMHSSRSGHYAPCFTQGATIVPRAFYCITPAQRGVSGRDLNKRKLVNCQTDPLILQNAHKPWDMTFQGRLETKYFFRTALAKNIVPFALAGLQLIVLPIHLKKHFHALVAEFPNDKTSAQMGEETREWFAKCEQTWDLHKTERNKVGGIDYLQWLNYRHKLTEQNLNTRYLVLYTAAATDACAAIVDRQDKTLLDFPFFADSSVYWYATNNLAEANYLLAFINAPLTNRLIKPFQARGLFGPRTIAKKILYLPLPKYDGKNLAHKKLATLAGQCTKAARKIADVQVDEGGVNDMTPHQLGRVRSNIRQKLGSRLAQIDEILATILK